VELQTFIEKDVICQQFIAHNTSSKHASLELLLDLRLGARWDYALRAGLVFGKSAGYSLCLLAGHEDEELVELTVQVFQEGKMEDIVPHFFREGGRPNGAEESGTTSNPQPLPQLLLSVDPGSSKELTVQYKLQKVIKNSRPKVDTEPRTSTETDTPAKLVQPNTSLSADSSSSHSMSSGASDLNVISSAEIHKGLERRCKTMLADEGESTNCWYYVSLTHVLVMPYIDVTASLNEEAKSRGGKWLQSSSPITKIFRRHLENILSVQSILVRSKTTSRLAVAITARSLDYNSCRSWSSLYEL
jgi:hypothetical protein